jgi:hypothetical protein
MSAIMISMICSAICGAAMMASAWILTDKVRQAREAREDRLKESEWRSERLDDVCEVPALMRKEKRKTPYGFHQR